MQKKKQKTKKAINHTYFWMCLCVSIISYLSDINNDENVVIETQELDVVVAQIKKHNMNKIFWLENLKHKDCPFWNYNLK